MRSGIATSFSRGGGGGQGAPRAILRARRSFTGGRGMKIGIFGTGDVAQSLAKGFLALGNEVKLGSRTANNEKGLAFAKEAGPKASVGTFADAAAFGEILAIATLGTVTEEVIEQAGPARLR